MSNMNVNSVLAQIRALSGQMDNPGMDRAAVDPQPAAKVSFSDTLRNAVDHVNGVQKEASAKSDAFAAGDPDVDIAEVMLALNRSSVSFKAMTEVRNRLVSAYQDIMNMPI